MLIIGTFANLVVIDVFLNMLYYLLIFVAAIRLRQKEPGLDRPFRIWGGTATLVAICAPAIFIALLTLYTNAIDTSTTIFGHDSFTIFGLTFGWYGIGGVIAMLDRAGRLPLLQAHARGAAAATLSRRPSRSKCADHRTPGGAWGVGPTRGRHRRPRGPNGADIANV